MQRFGGKFVKGSEPAAVYWRRRAIVAGAAIAVVLVAVFGIKAVGSNQATAEGQHQAETDADPQEWSEPSVSSTLKRPYVSATPEDGESGDDEPQGGDDESGGEASPSESEPGACADEELLLQVVAAFDEAASGTDVPVSVLVASTADDTCRAELSEVEVELASGDDMVYSSAHCHPAEAGSVELDQGAGQTVEFTVDGLASDPGCEGDRRRLPAGDYEVRARLGESVSQPAALTLT